MTTSSPPYLPYISPTSAYPSPDVLPNETGAISLPQLATQIVTSIPVYQLAFADSIAGIGNILEIQTGQYNASLAQSIFLSGFCRLSCSHHLPIVWDAPVPIAAYGGTTIQADAMATEGPWTFVAATTNNQTAVFFSGNYGTNGSWYTLTGGSLVSGGSPKIVANGCSAILTTLTGSNLIATTFTLPCGKPWTPPPPPPKPSAPNGGGGHPPGGSPPTVLGIVPSQSANSTFVQLNGTAFTGATQVLFGTQLSTSYTVLSSTAISAKVPAGTGTVQVRVTAGGLQSSGICPDDFNHGGTLALGTPEVSAINPNASAAGSPVTIYGAYFQSASTVKFGSTAATGVSLVAPGVLQATVPLGTGTVGVTVTNSVGTSPTFGCPDQFTIEAIPTVLSVAPDVDAAGQAVTIVGREFLYNASVYFGSTPASTFNVSNSTFITATIPTGSGLANVSIHQTGYVNPATCDANFTYGSAPPAAAPQVEWITPSRNLSEGAVFIAGYNFQANASVLFGGVPAPQVYYATSTFLVAQAPLGAGTVPIQVAESNGRSLPTCADRFTIQWPSAPSNFTRHSFTLPNSRGAAPLVIGGNPYLQLSTLGTGTTPAILASNVSNSEIVLYKPGGSGWVATNVAPFASFNAASPATSLGQTSLSVTNGSAGQVSAVGSGQSVFGVFTTYTNGQTVAETVGSLNGGATWAGPYAVAPGVGSIRDPLAAMSPSGYVYVTWRENTMGSWAVDQSIFWPSGIQIQAPSALKGSGGQPGFSAGAPSMVVDPFGRALYAWTFSTGTTSSISYSGGFVSAFNANEQARAGFNATTTADFENFGGAGVHSLRAGINVTLQKLENDTSNTLKLCQSQEVAYGSLYPNITTIDPAALILDPISHTCPLNTGAHDNSFVVAQTGPFAADIYLEVQASNLLEAVGIGTMPIPPWLTGLYSPPPPLSGSFVPGTGATYIGPAGTAMQVTPLSLNSGTVLLNASGVFAEKTSETPISYGGVVCANTTDTDEPTTYSTNLTVKNWAGTTTTVYTFNSNVQLPDIYVDNLRALRNGTWQEKITVTYADMASTTGSCPSSSGITYPSGPITPPAGWPSSFTKTLSGTYTTGLGYFPSNMTVNSTGVPGSPTTMNDTLDWENTIYSEADAWLNQTSGSPRYNAAWTNNTFEDPEEVVGSGFQSVPVGKPFKLTTIIQTKNSTVQPGWFPILNGNQVSTTQPVESLKYSCTFNQLANYQRMWWYASGVTKNVSNVTTYSATITWFSNGNNSGWVAYTDDNGIEMNQTAMVLTVTNPVNHTTYYEYVVQLNALEPWAVYDVVGHIRTTSGCAVYQNQTTQWQFETNATFPLAEEDLPYDSVSAAGGGAKIYFQIPYWFTSSTTFHNASLRYFPSRPLNASANLVIPIQSMPAWTYSGPSGLGFGVTYSLNLSSLSLNTTYNVSLTMNWTASGNTNVQVASQPFQFWYARDTSGDGLTDAEKARGWNVTAQLSGGWKTWHVAADNQSFATNGLVNDLVEKEYGLSPVSIDTPSSHMLDTWNLTFGLTGHGPSCPSNFECWFENGTDPFNYSQFPGGSHSGLALQLNRSNVTGSEPRVDDGTPYDAEVIWSNSRLTYLQGLIQNQSLGWLRATVGYYAPAHLWVLTVGGKLSWGANPLAFSTPGDGVADGARVDPLGDTYLNVTITGWNSVTTHGNGVAAFIDAASTPIPGTIQTDAALYTLQVTAGWGGSLYGGNLGLFYNFPVSDTLQYARLNVSLVTNFGGTYANNVTIGPVNVDLANDLVRAASQTAGSDYLDITYQAITVLAKAPTFIVVPKDNSSLSALPLGLARYTAEQNFVLVEVNATAPDLYNRTVTGINYPLANGTKSAGTYAVTLGQGLNNFLVPRSIFLQTPFGQDVLNATNTTIAGSNLGANLYYSPGQWYARATGGTYNGYNYKGTSGYISIYSNNQSQGCSTNTSLCGGVPANPNLAAGNETLAIQAILALNLSSFSQVDDFLAALLLNTTGNFSGWMFAATPYIPSLGLAQNVRAVLANSVLGNAGAFGAPSSSSQNPLSSWGAIGVAIWNTVSGIANAVAVVWNIVLAAAAYFDYLVVKAAAWLLHALNQVASVLATVASIIQAALNAFVAWVEWLIRQTLDGAFQWIVSAIRVAASAAESAFGVALNLVLGVIQGLLSASGSVVGGISNYIMPAAAFAVGVVIALNVVTDLAMPVAIGAGLLIGIIVPLLVTLVSNIMPLATPSQSQENSVANQFSQSAVTVAGGTIASQTLYNSTQHQNSSGFRPAVVYNSTPGGGLTNTSAVNLPKPGDPWAIVGAVVGFGGASILVRGAQAFPSDVAAQAAADLAAMVFFVLFFDSLFTYGSNLSCNVNPGMWTLAVFAAVAILPIALLSVFLGFRGLGRGVNPSSPIIAALGIGIGVASTGLAFADLNTLWGTRCSWM